VRKEVDTCRSKTPRETISRPPHGGERHQAKGELTDIHVPRVPWRRPAQLANTPAKKFKEIKSQMCGKWGTILFRGV
jgi:hypothetical protein